MLKNEKAMKRVILCLSAIMAMVCLQACRSERKGVATTADVLPAAPDYADSTQWYVADRQGQADIFYIISTETGDYPLANGHISHYADTYADSLRQPMRGEMVGVDTLLSGTLNFVSPYYRQCSLQSFVSDSLAEARMAVPTEDVRRAFNYFLTHLNQGRPFVLAGYSQGAMIALQLLSEMDDATYSRMVAAYLIGMSIPQQRVDGRRVRPAKRADDTGVTISYNTVRSDTCTLFPRSAIAINPVGWRTDDVAGLLITEPTPLLPVAQQTCDTLTVRLDTLSNLLIASGYTATDYVLPLIGREGNYHSREIWLYRHLLRQNIQQRVDAYRQ